MYMAPHSGTKCRGEMQVRGVGIVGVRRCGGAPGNGWVGTRAGFFCLFFWTYFCKPSGILNVVPALRPVWRACAARGKRHRDLTAIRVRDAPPPANLHHRTIEYRCA